MKIDEKFKPINAEQTLALRNGCCPRDHIDLFDRDGTSVLRFDSYNLVYPLDHFRDLLSGDRRSVDAGQAGSVKAIRIGIIINDTYSFHRRDAIRMLRTLRQWSASLVR